MREHAVLTEWSEYAPARTILGEDFISPEQVLTCCPIFYTEEGLAELRRKIPDQKILKQLRDEGYMLVAGPPAAMAMLDIRELRKDFFLFKGPGRSVGWYDYEEEKFAKTDKIEALCWIALRKEPVESSPNKTWLEQRALVVEPATIPNAAEATWTLTIYKAVNGVRLLSQGCIRTSSVAADGNHVYVGRFEADGINAWHHWDDMHDPSVGVSSCRKF